MNDQDRTLVDVLLEHGQAQPHKLAYRFLTTGETDGPTETRTYGALLRRVLSLAVRLRREGLSGERALLLYPGGLEYVEGFLACLAAGVVAVPAYPPDPGRLQRTLPRLQAVASDADVKAVLTTGAIKDLMSQFGEHDPHLATRTSVATDEVDESLAPEWQRPNLDGESIAFLQYTSGSTALPKGVIVTHGNLMHNERQIQIGFDMKPTSIVVGWLPLFHDMGLIGNVLQILYNGSTVTLMSPIDFLQRPLRWLRAMSHFKADTSGGPNFAFDLCVRKAKAEEIASLDLSSWRIAFTGSEPVRAETVERFARTFAPCGFEMDSFSPCYGLAEATLFVTGGRTRAGPVVRSMSRHALAEGRVRAAEAAEDGVRLTGCGHPWLDQEVAIVAPDTNRRVAAGVVGEIWVRGANVARGYWNRPEATAQTFRACIADTGEEPFLRTGDLGYLSDDELFVTGRLKDLIIVRGRNHYPQDIEQTVERSHAALRPGNSIAFSIETGGHEKLVIAAEVDERSGPIDFEEVIGAICAAVNAEHQLQVHAAALLPPRAIPKTSSGKLQRRACRSAFEEGTLGALAVRTFDGMPMNAGMIRSNERVLAWFSEYVAKHGALPLSAYPPDVLLGRSVTEIGLDSLAVVNLVSDAEDAFGVSLDSADVARHTVRDLIEALARTSGATEAAACTSIPAAATGPNRLSNYVDEHLAHLEAMVGAPLAHPFDSAGTLPQIRIGGKVFLNFSSNDYLGLATHPQIKEGALRAIRAHGAGPGGSRHLSGNLRMHGTLESAIAALVGAEDSITFPTGLMANAAIFRALSDVVDPSARHPNERLVVLSDELNHASIFDGIEHSSAKCVLFRHNDIDDLRARLEQMTSWPNKLIVTEGVFALEGHCGALPQIVELAQQYDCKLMVDDAHGVGILGEKGGGAIQAAGVAGAVDIIMGSFDKALGAMGGYLAGNARLIQFLRFTARSYIFSSAVPAVMAGAVVAAVRIASSEAGQRLRMRAFDNSVYLASLLEANGFTIIGDRSTPAVPLLIGPDAMAIEVSRRLFRRKVFIAPFIAPAVPRGQSRLRITVTAAHTREHLHQLVNALLGVFAEVGLWRDENG
jgi:8-amino-7-oxononanoate synthase